MLDKLLRRLSIYLGLQLKKAESGIAKRSLPHFANKPKGLEIHLPFEIDNAEYIHLGDNVKLGPNSSLRVKTKNPGTWLKHPEGKHLEQTFKGKISLGHGVTATANLQLTAFKHIAIEDDVMFAANVFISDGTHGYQTAQVPYKYQGIEQIAPIKIGQGSWIGQNAVIMPGVSIGELCIIGANSVVSQDIPPKSIAVGSPARVVKTWSEEKNAWLAVK